MYAPTGIAAEDIGFRSIKQSVRVLDEELVDPVGKQSFDCFCTWIQTATTRAEVRAKACLEDMILASDNYGARVQSAARTAAGRFFSEREPELAAAHLEKARELNPGNSEAGIVLYGVYAEMIRTGLDTLRRLLDEPIQTQAGRQKSLDLCNQLSVLEEKRAALSRELGIIGMDGLGHVADASSAIAELQHAAVAVDAADGAGDVELTRSYSGTPPAFAPEVEPEEVVVGEEVVAPPAEPCPECAVDNGAVSFAVGSDFTNAYFFRGVVQEKNGLVWQPWAEVSFTLWEAPERDQSGLLDARFTVGTSDSVHTNKTGLRMDGTGPGNWYESDLYAGLATDIGLGAGVTYIAYMSPNNAFGTVQEIDLDVSYDDAGLYGRDMEDLSFSTNPHLLWAFEVDKTAFGNEKSIYMEAGIEPAVTVMQNSDYPVTIGVPLTLGLSLDNYYLPNDGPGGSNPGHDTFGYASVGLGLGVPLSFAPAQFGSFSAGVSSQWLALGVNLQRFNVGVTRVPAEGRLGEWVGDSRISTSRGRISAGIADGDSPNGRALIVGNNSREGAVLFHTLSFAARDAASMAAALESFGFSTEQLVDDAAKSQDIRSSLWAEVKRSSRESHFLFYFAGHGVSDESGERYIVTSGGGLAGVDYLSLDEIGRILSHHRGKTHILVDSCFEETGLVDLFPVDTSSAGSYGKNVPALFVAAGVGQVSGESRQLESGLFTRALLDELATADASPKFSERGSRWSPLDQLAARFETIQKATEAYAKERGFEQRPESLNWSEGHFKTARWLWVEKLLDLAQVSGWKAAL